MNPNREHIGDVAVTGPGALVEFKDWLRSPPRCPALRRKRDKAAAAGCAIGLILLVARPEPSGAWYWWTLAFVVFAFIGEAAEWLPSHAARATTRLRGASAVLVSAVAVAAFAALLVATLR